MLVLNYCGLSVSGRRVQLRIVYEVPHSSNDCCYRNYCREAEHLRSGNENGVDQASQDRRQLQDDNPERLLAFGEIVLNGAVHKAAEMQAEANENDRSDGCNGYRSGEGGGHLTILVR